MSLSVDLYGTAYGNFAAKVLAQVRCDTYGEDFGQSSWVTGQEYRRFFRLLRLAAADHVLDVGCGSGGPALFLAREAGCRVTGVDVSAAGIQAGRTLARRAGRDDQVHLRRADVREPLPFPDGPANSPTTGSPPIPPAPDASGPGGLPGPSSGPTGRSLKRSIRGRNRRCRT